MYKRKPRSPIAMLKDLTDRGFCPSLHYDDKGHWAVSDEATTPGNFKGKFLDDIYVTCFIPAYRWKDSLEEAIKETYKEFTDEDYNEWRV